MPLDLVDFFLSTLMVDGDLSSAFIGKVWVFFWGTGWSSLVLCIPLPSFFQICCGNSSPTPLYRILPFGYGIAVPVYPRRHPRRSGWVAPFFQSWDTSHLKNLILAVNWEVPWLWACGWCRSKALVPFWWGLCWRLKGIPA